jgi:hypothetical protein
MGGFGFVIGIEILSFFIFYNYFSIIINCSKLSKNLIKQLPFLSSRFLYKHTIKYIYKWYNKKLNSSFFIITTVYINLFKNLIKQEWKNPFLYYCLNMTYISINVLFILIFNFIIFTNPLSLFASMDLFNNNSDCFINYAYLALDFNYISINLFWIMETDIFINFLSSFEHNFEYSIDFSLNYNNDLNDRMIDYSNSSNSNFNGENLPGPDWNGTNSPQSNWEGGNSPQPNVDDLIRGLNSDLLNTNSDTVVPMEMDNSDVTKDVTKEFLMSEKDNDTRNIWTMFDVGIEVLKNNVLTRPIRQKTVACEYVDYSWISAYYQWLPQYQNIQEITGIHSFFNGYSTDILTNKAITSTEIRELASSIIKKINSGLPVYTYNHFSFCRSFEGAFYDLNHTFNPTTIYPWFHPYHTKMALVSLENNTTPIIINLLTQEDLYERLSCVYPVDSDDVINIDQLSIEYKYLSLHEINRIVDWYNLAKTTNWNQINF